MRSPTPEMKKQVLRWTAPWYVFCIAFSFVWVRYPLTMSSTSFSPASVFLLAAVTSSVVIVIASKRFDSMFDKPPFLSGMAASLLAGTALMGLPLLLPANPLGSGGILAGLVLSGIGSSVMLVLWCEYLSRIPTSQVVFSISINLLLSLILDFLVHSMNGTGMYFALLLCVILTAFGIRRSWESLRASLPLKQDDRPPKTRYPWMMFIALLVYLVSLVIIKSLAFGHQMVYVSYGGGVAPVIVLATLALSNRFKFDWFCKIALPFAVASVMMIAYPITGSLEWCIILADATFALLFILMAAVGSTFTFASSANVCRLSSVGFIVMVTSMLLGGALSDYLKTVFPFGSGFAIIAVCCFAIVVCTVVCLMDNDCLSHEISIVGGPSAGTPTILKSATGTIAQRYHLRKREQEVLELLLGGKSSGEIARELFIAQGTVKTHIHNLYLELDVHTRDELFELVRRESENDEA